MNIHIRIQEEAFDPATEERELRQMAGGAGATVTFQGYVRGNDYPVPLSTMLLEHFSGVTENEIMRIATASAKHWPVTGIRVIHRVGTLLPNEAIVFIAIASAHRSAAFSAAQFLMDFLKTDAPFWKKEFFSDGTAYWVEAKASDRHASDRWTAGPR